MDSIKISLNGKIKQFTSKLDAISFLMSSNSKVSKARKTTLSAIAEGCKILSKI
jgi:hypothetical protein